MASEKIAFPILIVDDDEPTQALLRTLLRKCGYVCEVASDGHEAIARLRTGRYAAVVLDMMMPRAGGQEVVDFLSATSNPVPVVICSAVPPSMVADLDGSVVKAIVRKPFDVTEFAAAVTAVAHQGLPVPRVLVVDDDVRARYTLRAFLDAAEVTEAETGQEALDMIRNAPPDLVLLDLILPGVPGDELLERLAEQEETRAVPVIVVTCRVLSAEERSTLLRHAAAVIYKGDLSRATLLQAVEAALSGTGASGPAEGA
jgi:CheY-like chemotaxis protein